MCEIPECNARFVDTLYSTDFGAGMRHLSKEHGRHSVRQVHQRAVLHRDLKPSNILATAKGFVKLVDFGIAKLIRPESFGQQAVQTQPNDRALTPQYASPEQFRGEPPLTSSDVYSLGAVLYELLVGRLPYSLSNRSWAQMEIIVSEQIPPLPSSTVAATSSNGPIDCNASSQSNSRMSATNDSNASRLSWND